MSTGKRVRKNPEAIEQNFAAFAQGKLREGFDVVILAHSHLPQSCSFEINGRKAHYFNVGDWITHFSFLRYRHDSGFQIEYFQ